MITPVLTTKPGHCILSKRAKCLYFHPYTLQPRHSPIHPTAQTFTHTPYSPDFHPYTLQPRLSPIHPTAQTFTHTPYSPDIHPYTLQPRLSPIHPTAQTFTHTPYSPDFHPYTLQPRLWRIQLRVLLFVFDNEMKQKLGLTTSSQSACVQLDWDHQWLTGITNKDSVSLCWTRRGFR